MRLIVTGGGTGGHIYPALEVARLAAERGAEIVYLGSLRGQEGAICSARNIQFFGFPSAPLYSLKGLPGWKSLGMLAHSTLLALRKLRELRPDKVFSTGGYSAAPVTTAARSLGVPYHLHACDSVPGRAIRTNIGRAAGVTCTFYTTLETVPTAKRTGQPIRPELRAAAQSTTSSPDSLKSLVLGLGGSQGSVFVNESLRDASKFLPKALKVLLATGRGNFEKLAPFRTPQFEPVPYLEVEQLVTAYSHSLVAVARSGGTIAEFAMFGLPSVLIPLPSAADDHQRFNALEFVRMGGATLLAQEGLTPVALAEAVTSWSDPAKCAQARESLQRWDNPNATNEIVEAIFNS